ncbi:ester cyclase [Goodfellowiella coeruleoviolacea]|uniref:Ester cyclase n=1 Tax=Goodfellowiella coeruleoviolacea TaxID=334858 RepID=A0AAE3KDH9_9PSEU|nr:ester cyclase [Goodfellowiella coeruleoviolacea]MCP2164091.1 putative ester cyclase [Goodfellowiella coeruleoviolacea]
MSEHTEGAAARVPQDLRNTAAQIPPEILEVALGVSRVFATLDEEAARRYIAPDFVDHEASPGVGGGPQGYLTTARYMRTAFSEATWQPDDFFAFGDRFAVRVTFSGRHTGEFLGVPPTGNEVRVQHLHFYRVAGGQAVEHWGARDELKLLRQIGVFTPDHPTPADAGAALFAAEQAAGAPSLAG